MKQKLMTALLFVCMLFSCAAAQTLPGVEVFSPGLLRVNEKLAGGEGVAMEAALSVTDMLYARDLSVLQAMLEGTTFSYTGTGSAKEGGDRLAISRGGETLLDVSMAREEGSAQLAINGRAYGVDLSGFENALSGADALNAAAILERVPLTAVGEWFEGFCAGDMLALGFAVTEPFTVARTMSDDGERLTRLDIEGEIARAGETPYRVQGYLRQPGGKSPKDTFEIILTQDEKNFVELSYSALRTSEITRKNKAGEMEVDTTLKAAGKVDGSSFSSRLRVIARNAWTADGENLHEKVTVSATLGHTDHAPERRMQRLNDLSVKLRCVLALDTCESENPQVQIAEQTTLSAVFDGSTFLDVGLKGTAQVGAQVPEFEISDAPVVSGEEIVRAFEDAAVQMAKMLYPQLSEKIRDKVGAGL